VVEETFVEFAILVAAVDSRKDIVDYSFFIFSFVPSEYKWRNCPVGFLEKTLDSKVWRNALKCLGRIVHR
jgi:hypothetical protein